MKEKIICIRNNDTTELNKYLEEGWVIRNMTSCGCYTHTVCYVRLSKESYEHRTSSNIE